MIRPAARSTLFPYTTLFRSAQNANPNVRKVNAITAIILVFVGPMSGFVASANPKGVSSASPRLRGTSYLDRKSTRLNSSHGYISYAVFCLKKKTTRRSHPNRRRRTVCRHFCVHDTTSRALYPLSLHDALPICTERKPEREKGERYYRHHIGLRWTDVRICGFSKPQRGFVCQPKVARHELPRSEEHTSELQSRLHLVCRLLLEKKNHTTIASQPTTAHSLPTLLCS